MTLFMKIAAKLLRDFQVVGVLGFLLIGSIYFSGFGSVHLNKTVFASQHYGIMGQPAPELNLSDWIDGRGKQIGPITIKSLRGRVIYLYFFQDW